MLSLFELSIQSNRSTRSSILSMPTNSTLTENEGPAYSPKEILDQLIRAIYASDEARYVETYRQALNNEGMVEELSNFILKDDYSSIEGRLIVQRFGSLFNLLHDLDEAASLRIGEELIAKPCNPAIASEIRLVTSRLASHYDREDICSIEIFFSKDLPSSNFAKRKVRRWIAALPADHLHGLQRIYVLPEGGSGDDRIGAYFSTFRRICFDWDETFHPLNPLAWVLGPLLLPQTLLHEVGHHVLGHNGGPRDPRKERAADNYAAMMWGTWHPAVIAVVKLVSTCLRLLLRKLPWTERFRSKLLQRKALLRDGVEETRLIEFERSNRVVLSDDLKKLLFMADGMNSDSFCENGFRFRGLAELETTHVNDKFEDGDGSQCIVFADYLPTGVKYLIKTNKDDKDFGSVLRDNCRTRSGHLKVASSFQQFANQYCRNRALLSG